MKTKLIFESINKCTGNLPGSVASTFHTQRYTVFGHLRTFYNAFASGAWQLTIKCSNDDRIFLCQNLAVTSYSAHDTGACNRYTLIHKIIGTCKSSRHRLGVGRKVFLSGAFSLLLLCFLVTGSVFHFFLFSFKILNLNSSI